MVHPAGAVPKPHARTGTISRRVRPQVWTRPGCREDTPASNPDSRTATPAASPVVSAPEWP